MFDITFNLNTIATVAGRMSSMLDVRMPLLLYGEMGAGKTTLTKHIIKALGCADEVTSPTFNIMQSYNVGKGVLWHVDLYRLDDPNSIEELGLDELNTQNLLIIEWPERLGREFNPHIKCVLEVLANDQRRLVWEKIYE
ncbi:MAG: tRNA (adenosine(37)-N6)-threonylcarbamoyltransferase complex ATPase subunit type 1 TsaE [Proteobacteria bacterium]|nr:tRNA (adenosine(37)-N6)-threonylcarbamoyltransferase complex ATPase subunit type 1 TsaE [Pseudomonadota bacterium]